MFGWLQISLYLCIAIQNKSNNKHNENNKQQAAANISGNSGEGKL